MFRNLKDARGISLVEFLLNVAVLIILFALAFPAYIAFREKIEISHNRSDQPAEVYQESRP